MNKKIERKREIIKHFIEYIINNSVVSYGKENGIKQWSSTKTYAEINSNIREKLLFKKIYLMKNDIENIRKYLQNHNLIKANKKNSSSGLFISEKIVNEEQIQSLEKIFNIKIKR